MRKKGLNDYRILMRKCMHLKRLLISLIITNPLYKFLPFPCALNDGIIKKISFAVRERGIPQRRKVAVVVEAVVWPKCSRTGGA